MTTGRLLDDELIYIEKQAYDYVEAASNFRRYMPVQEIPLARSSKWYTVGKIQEPASSLDGTITSLVATAYTEESAPLTYFSSHFEWSEIDVESARRAGSPLQADDIRLGYAKMDKRIERLALQGNMTWDPVTISGILTGATDVGGTTALDAVYWATPVGGPYQHALAGFDVLTAAGFEPPFKWLLSSNLRAGLAAKESAEGPAARLRIADAFGIDAFEFIPVDPLLAAAVAHREDLDTYPMPPPATDEGYWAMIKSDVQNFAVQEVHPPKLTIIPEIDVRTRKFYARLDWVGTVRVTQATAVVDENDVDLAV